MRLRLPAAVLAVLGAFVAAAATASASLPFSADVARSVAAGGKQFVVKSNDGRLVIRGSRKALPRGIRAGKIKVVKIPARKARGTDGAYRLKPKGLKFRRPVTFTLKLPRPRSTQGGGGFEVGDLTGDRLTDVTLVSLFAGGARGARFLGFDGRSISRETREVSITGKKGSVRFLFYLFGLAEAEISNPGNRFVDESFDVTANINLTTKPRRRVKISGFPDMVVDVAAVKQKGTKRQTIDTRPTAFGWSKHHEPELDDPSGGSVLAFDRKPPGQLRDFSVRKPISETARVRCEDAGFRQVVRLDAEVNINLKIVGLSGGLGRFRDSADNTITIGTRPFDCIAPLGGGGGSGGGGTATAPTIDVLVPGYAHPMADPPSYACVEVTGTPGAQVEVTATTANGAFGLPATKTDPMPARPKTDSQTVTLPAGGKITVMFKIWQPGDYNFSLTASKDGLTSATSTTSITVEGGPAETVVGPPDCGTSA